MNLNRYSHLIFDFDYTLAKIQIDWSNWVKGINQILKKYDPAVDENIPISHTRINDFIKQFGPTIQSEIWAFSEAYELAHTTGLIEIPAALATLRKLNTNQQAHLYTSNCRKVIMPFLTQLKIEHLFSKIVTLNEVKLIKPHPDGFALIFNPQHQLTDYVMIGDSASDSGMAKNAGIDFIHVSELTLN